MKALFSLVAAAAIGTLGMASASAQNLKVGTVDLQKIFAAYNKTKEAQKTLATRDADLKKEVEERTEAVKKEYAAAQKLNDEMERPELSKDAKEAKLAERNKKLNEGKVMEQELRQFTQRRQRDLLEQKNRIEGDVIKDIKGAVKEIAKSKQLDLVLDNSGESSPGITQVLYANATWDFTDTVIESLNKGSTAPAAEAAPAATPAPKRR